MIPLLQNILDQPENLARVTDYHLGEGREALHEAAREIGSGRQLVFSGMGSSLFECIPVCNALAARGRFAAIIDSAELLHYESRVCRDAVIVLVSRSGESVEVVKALPLLREQGATIVAVTNELQSTLAREADHVLSMASRADQAVAVQTFSATLATFYLLGAAMAGELESAAGELRSLVRALERSLPDWVAASETWRPFFQGAHCLYLLARGASLASAEEGALLFHEVAKFPAVSMGAGAFRHGPVEVIDPDFRALVFAAPDPTLDLNLALARDIRALGGQARTIGPAGDWPIPEVAAPLAPVIEIVPVQLAALRLAEWRGVVPGQFRAASLVTRTESGF